MTVWYHAKARFPLAASHRWCQGGDLPIGGAEGGEKMDQPTKGCVTTGANCHRSHYALASHLPTGVCQMLAHRVISHYEAGDFEQAETLAQFLMQAVVERKEAHWAVYAQLLLA